jgi:hypothetical protein
VAAAAAVREGKRNHRGQMSVVVFHNEWWQNSDVLQKVKNSGIVARELCPLFSLVLVSICKVYWYRRTYGPVCFLFLLLLEPYYPNALFMKHVLSTITTLGD